MNFNPFKKKQTAEPVEQRSYDVHVPEKVFIEREGPFYEYSEQEPAALKTAIYGLINGYYGQQNFIKLFNSVPEVFAPVHEIASRVADGNFLLCKDWNDEVDWKDAEFNRLFTQPNPLVSLRDLVYQAVCYEILTGRQFFFFNRPDTLPDEYRSVLSWSNLPAHNITVTHKKGVDPFVSTQLSDFITDYRMPLGEKTRIFEPEKVLPICHTSLDSNYDLNKCSSFLLGAEIAIRNLIPVYQARGVIYIKRGAMGFIVSEKGDATGKVALTPKEKASITQTINDMYGVQAGQSTIGVTDQPISFVKTSMSLAEMMPFDETYADALAIYSCLRVPKHLAPSLKQSTFDNADADMKSFYSNVIMPWGRRYAELWTNFLKLKDFRRYIKADYSHVDVLQENRKEKADVSKTEGDTWLQRFLHGICTLNDWIVATDGFKVTGNPVYDKKIFEMEPDELEKIKSGLTMKAPAMAAPQPEAGQEGAAIVPLKKVVNE